MTPEQIAQSIGNLPWMTLSQGKTITSFIHEHKTKDILELGFCHGVSTCYFAAAVNHNGSVVTIDREVSQTLSPNVEELLTKLQLRHKVQVYYETSSYVWRLMKMIEEDPTPRFDLCYIDGAHMWHTDGFAFFLVDRLLRPGGWIIFDDLDWKVANCRISRDKEWAQKLSEEERNTAQIRKVYELLVKPHPSYSDFRVEDEWAYARKSEQANPANISIKQETIVKSVPVPLEINLLRHGEPHLFFNEILKPLRCQDLSNTARNALQNLCSYFAKHYQHINYAKYKQDQLPIGSGMVESACKWLIQQRFKGVGMRWSEKGFNHLLHLRLAWVNENFDELFDHKISPPNF